ncbi:MAG: antibiotic biosynthesis monooxygenase [Proteobacteria bacterium]|nr:antibiotic biosynthesis monooxygenase [Burkholderiales bacterium]
MLAVIFEVIPLPGRAPRYFEIAAALRPVLERIDGFISVERFESLSRPGVYLSLSYWRDEQAISRWRNEACHRAGQHDGREAVFEDYRIRVMAGLRDYGFHDRLEAPMDSNTALL